MMKISAAFLRIACISVTLLLAGCASDKQMGLCTDLGLCSDDPDEVKEKADKKWWCEYYSGKNCGDDEAASASTSKGSDDAHSGGDHSSGHDDAGGGSGASE